jgi:hypothetical protein
MKICGCHAQFHENRDMADLVYRRQGVGISRIARENEEKDYRVFGSPGLKDETL